MARSIDSDEVNVRKAIKLPSHTNSNRPGHGSGKPIWNSSAGKIQFSDGSSWLDIKKPLFEFVSPTTFTPGSASPGREGPSLSEAQGGISPAGQEWIGDSAFFSVTGGIMKWTVPETGTWRIDAYGADGGDNTNGSSEGGDGARIRGDFSLTAGEQILILVGHKSEDHSDNCGGGVGGGGGTFVVKDRTGAPSTSTTSDILVIAGGGGGGGFNSNFDGKQGNSGNNGTSGNSVNGGNGGSGGNGGEAPDTGGCNGGNLRNEGTGGGGFSGDGEGFGNGGYELGKEGGGESFQNGGNGGLNQSWSGSVGGFGGGGGAYSSAYGSSGGGGYSGGGGGGLNGQCNCQSMGGGGGGGSYNNGSNQVNTTGGNGTGDGKVIITKV